MKQLKFEHSYAVDIQKGRRHTTLRIDDKGLRIGENIQLVDKVSSNKPQQWEVTGEMTVVGIQEFELGYLPLELVQDAEIASTDKQKVLDFLRRFYGDKITDTTVVKLITFTYQPYAQPLKYLSSETLADGAVINKVVLYADGGSRGNPGPSAAGFVVEDEVGRVLESWNKYLGITTNNQAEYHGLIAGLEWCEQRRIVRVDVRLDSLLVVNQLKGVFKVKNRDLWTLYETAKRLQNAFEAITFTHVPRALNSRADAEVNKALDAIKGADIIQ